MSRPATRCGAAPPYAFSMYSAMRLRTNRRDRCSRDFTAGMWLDILERNPGLRYVSDGNPETVSFPRGRESELAPAFTARAKPY